MRNATTTLFCVLLSVLVTVGGCGSSEPTAPQSSADSQIEPVGPAQASTALSAEPGAFVLDLNGQTEIGSGVVFVDGESLLIRGLVGTADEHFELNIGGAREGDHPLPADTTISAVVGGDAVDPGQSFVVVDAPANTLTVMRDAVTGRVSGTFEFLAMPEESGNAGGGQIPVKGSFDLDAADASDWLCDFGPTNIANCRFVAG